MTVCRSVGVIGRNFLSPMGRSSSLDLLEQLDLLIGLERHDGLLPVVAPARRAPLALQLALQLHGLDGVHLHMEHGLDGPFDLDLVGVARHFEEVLAERLTHDGALLGDEHLADDRTRIRAHFEKTSFTRASPSCVSSSCSQSSRSYGFSWCASVVVTSRRLRTDFHTASFCWSTTSSVFLPSRPIFLITPATRAVLGAPSTTIPSITLTAFSLARSDSAPRSAVRRCCFGMSVRWLRGLGPNARPPPGMSGDVFEPWRALPVPFCLNGFLPPPETRPLFFTIAVPWRWFPRWRFTDSHSRCSFTGCANSSSGRAVVPFSLPSCA